LFGAEIFAGDETGGVVFAAVDFEACAEALEGLAQASVVLAKDALGDEGLDVGVDACHCLVSGCGRATAEVAARASGISCGVWSLIPGIV
jgi:hypothetical protein